MKLKKLFGRGSYTDQAATSTEPQTSPPEAVLNTTEAGSRRRFFRRKTPQISSSSPPNVQSVLSTTATQIVGHQETSNSTGTDDGTAVASDPNHTFPSDNARPSETSISESYPPSEPPPPYSPPTSTSTSSPTAPLLVPSPPTVATHSTPMSLVLAARSNNLSKLRSLLAANPSLVNARGPHMTTALIQAAKQGKAEAVQFLLEHDADPSLKDGDNMTAAAHAKGRYPAIAALLGAPPPTKYEGKLPELKGLLNRGVQPDGSIITDYLPPELLEASRDRVGLGPNAGPGGAGETFARRSTQPSDPSGGLGGRSFATATNTSANQTSHLAAELPKTTPRRSVVAQPAQAAPRAATTRVLASYPAVDTRGGVSNSQRGLSEYARTYTNPTHTRDGQRILAQYAAPDARGSVAWVEARRRRGGR